MKPFTYERARRRPRPRAGRRAHARRQVHRRRHQPARPDEAADRDADAPGRRERPRRSTGSSRRRKAACASARWCATPTSPPTSASGATMASCRARCSLAPPGSCATRRPPPATCSSAPAAPTSTTPTMPCNKRQPGSGCSALGGVTRKLAIIGVSEACIATHPERHGGRHAGARCDGGDRAARRRARSIPIAEFHRLPGDTPHIETTLEPGELITAVTLPPPLGGTQIYRKVRDRASYAFALVSVAAVVQPDGTGASRWAAWRTSPGASSGRRPSCRAAPSRPSRRSLRRAQPTHDNAFKITAGRADACRRAGRGEGLTMRFDTPATHEPDRPTQGGRPPARPHRRSAQDHRHRAVRL